ncbi:hypothetical protein ACIG53_13715 [Streptomyces bauhiniae]|uniref:hypothetical protein n=1 Tax=Streptomyces bauhiniae TaxID=2340725 RepID=UPI0037CCEC1D
MSEVDEQRIAELAKQPPRVLRGCSGPGARSEARKVVEVMALMSREVRGEQSEGDG